MQNITPVLLAGGSGSRLWPLSRKSYPKQFSPIIDDVSLFQKSVQRLQSSDTIFFKPPITVTNEDFRFIVASQMQEIGIDPGPILIEPEAKNTAAAILAASFLASIDDPNAILLVSPSDHLMADIRAFHNSVSQALPAIEKGKIVTFGVQPNKPETGYGYLEVISNPVHKFSEVKAFIEKPDAETAQEMLDIGDYLWNSGIFMFRASDMIEAFEKYEAGLIDSVSHSVMNRTTDLDFVRLDPKSWMNCKEISIDYAVMERADNLVSVPLSCNWTDLGSWDAIWEETINSEDAVATSQNAHAFNCKNTLLRSENRDLEIIGIGLTDIVAVAMPDAVLVANKDHTQQIKDVITQLRNANIRQIDSFPKDHRPWGWFESLIMQGRFQVKRILVEPGESLSLQSHHHRSEHWIVVNGTARVTIDDEVKLITEGESVYIPCGAIHRLENPGKLPMVLIEVQTGPYLGEDDIVRYEDRYSRHKQ